ncbi:carboxylesterase/lipase family protein [Sunxiuqinia sp. A32]|uniref:carboxylesterase/lipase family protein n=1 Tax=Sunxiuqinia sp. A32 TaxID=3461496 RepID=UPI0040460CEE
MKLLQKLTLTILFSIILLPAMAQDYNSLPVQREIENGVIEGFYDVKTGIQHYLGIPFAQPPVGELRWKAPQPVKNWKGVKETKSFGPRAIQGVPVGNMKSRANGMSEDCLYLNVWSPAKRNEKGIPVLVYFYGGGFRRGDGSELRYDGASTAQKGIVVVTINYRLNIFGFLAHPELSAESPYKASGNYGLLDQNAALKWVQTNIAVFGGDPAKVTIAGESAGSLSVSAQMATPLSKGLFQGAIGESGAIINPLMPPVPLDKAEQVGIEMAKKVGNLSLEQLRSLSALEIWEIYWDSKNTRFPLVLDGYFFPKNLEKIFETKEQSQVPLLVGWNSAESSGDGFMRGLDFTPENFEKRVKENYPDDFREILKLYPHGNINQVEYAAKDLASDGFIGYSTWKWFDLHRKNSEEPVYRYLFRRILPPKIDHDTNPGMAENTNTSTQKSLGAKHASEIDYCMGNLSINKDFAWTKDDYAVSKTMQEYFANFIKTGNPNGLGLAEWKAAAPSDDAPSVMIIDVESKLMKAYNDERYRLLDKIFQNQ